MPRPSLSLKSMVSTLDPWLVRERPSFTLMVLSMLITLSVACSGGRPPPVDPALSSVSSNHNQVSERLSPTLLAQLKEAKIILIGETHDHPQHHLIQAEVIKRLKPKSVAFEMVNAGQQASLNSLKGLPTEQWDEALAWSKRGWPNFELYRPVFEAAISVNAQLIAAHPDPKILNPLKLGGELPQALRERLKLDQALPKAHRLALLEELNEAHCGHAPPAIAEAMLKAQRLKDAWMAETVLKAPHTAILIVGRGHVHPQRGIPWAIELLSHEQADEGQAKVHVLSLSPSRQPSSSADQGLMSQLIVAPHRQDDPCERFREQLKRMRERRGVHTHSKE